MADAFHQFAQRAAQLASESDQLKANREDVAVEIDQLNEKIYRLRARRDDIDGKLAQVEEHQKVVSPFTAQSPQSANMFMDQAMMRGFVVSNSRPTAPSESSHSPTSKEKQNATPAIEYDDDIPLAHRSRKPSSKSVIEDTGSGVLTSPQPVPKSLDTSLEGSNSTIYQRCCRADNPIHPNYPTVILMDRNWTEISCGLCGANASHDASDKQPKFHHGMLGLNVHCRADHGQRPGRNMKDTLRTCKRRVVSNEDVTLMQLGKQPKVRIVPNVGAGALKDATPNITEGGQRSQYSQKASDRSFTEEQSTAAFRSALLEATSKSGQPLDSAFTAISNRAALEGTSTESEEIAVNPRGKESSKGPTAYDEMHSVRVPRFPTNAEIRREKQSNPHVTEWDDFQHITHGEALPPRKRSKRS